jgi:hypothetical protein
MRKPAVIFTHIPHYTSIKKKGEAAGIHTEFFGRVFCPWKPRAKNRAFRFKSSEAPMRFLWAFRCNAPEDGRFPIGIDCSGRYRAPGIPRARTSAGSGITSLPPSQEQQLLLLRL